jgi:hypothetical protein
MLLSGCADAQDREVVVGDIDFPQRVWGSQNIPFEVTNHTDWLKFLVVETDVSFEGSYVNPHRVTRSNFYLEPGARTIDPVIEIPPNYGKLTFWLRIYDVVDTLDDLSLGTKVFEQPFNLRFHTPEAVIPYFQERLSLPPLVGHAGSLDNEFSRLLLVLIEEGRSIEAIAEMCATDTLYVWETAVGLARLGYFNEDRAAGTIGPRVPVIDQSFASEARAMAELAADRLSEKIAANLAGRRPLMDSLIQAGVYSGDSTNFFEGGTLLYHTYPLVGGMYLWQVLGTKFVAGKHKLYVFENTNPCQPRIGGHMYVVQGGDHFNGHHYFDASSNQGALNATWGDRIPEVICKPGFEKRFVLRENVDWNYAPEYAAESFLYDTTLLNPMMRTLDEGVDDILREIAWELRDLSNKHEMGEPLRGTLYWYWNLTATLTLDRLVESGALTRSGNGQFRLMEKK